MKHLPGKFYLLPLLLIFSSFSLSAQFIDREISVKTDGEANSPALYNNFDAFKTNIEPDFESEEADDNRFHQSAGGAHVFKGTSGACVPGTVNRFTGSYHSNLYIGNNAGSNVVLAWGQVMSTYIGGAPGDLLSPTTVSAASYNGVPLEVRSSSSGGAAGLSAFVMRTSTDLYVFGTAANLTLITSMAGFGGATLTTAASNVTAKLPAGVLITDIAQVAISQTAFAIVTNTGHVYVLTKVVNLQGDKATAGPAIWHHVTLSDGTTFLSGVTNFSLSSSGAFALTSGGNIYYWGAPANVSGVVNTATSYNYAFDMSAQIPGGTTVKDLVCLGTKAPSSSTLFIMCANQKVYGCGLNTQGCLGINNATVTFNQPTFVTVKTTDGITDLTNVVKIDGDTEADIFCMGAITSTGQIFGWGDSPAGMLGVNASTGSFAVPKTVQLFTPTPGLNYTDFSVAGHFFISFYSSGATDQYWYLGHNISGSVGDPTNATTFILAAAPASLNSSGGVSFNCSNVLAANTLTFSAQKNNTNVLLKWSTAFEQNTRDFLVQHKIDGTSWSIIGTVQAAGNSITPRNYSFPHLTPPKGTNYYRLLEENLDGNSTYSKVVSVVFATGAKQIIISPNVIGNGTLNIELQESAVANIFNSVGALILQKQLYAGTQTIDISSLAADMYLLRAGNDTVSFLVQ